MPPDILPDFYRSKTGRIVRRILKAHMLALWGDCAGHTVLGLGYTTPYIRAFSPQATTVCTHGDTVKLDNLDHTAVALKKDVASRIIMIHDLEFCHDVPTYLAQIGRALTDDGRIVMIIPARRSRWSHLKWSPFGHGTSFTKAHIARYINDHSQLSITYIARALYMPPTQNRFILRGAGAFEFFGKHAGGLFPALGGVHIIEAVKTKYAGTTLRDKPLALHPKIWGTLSPEPNARTNNINNHLLFKP